MDIFKKEIKEIISKEKQSFTYKELVEELLTKYPRSFDKRMIEELNESLKELEESKDIEVMTDRTTEVYKINRIKNIKQLYSYEIEYEEQDDYENCKWNIYNEKKYTPKEIAKIFNEICENLKTEENEGIIDIETFSYELEKRYNFFEIEPEARLVLKETGEECLTLNKIDINRINSKWIYADKYKII